MCGRFTLTLDADGLQAAFPGFAQPKMVAPRYNIAPTQPVLAIPNKADPAIEFFMWGLIPGWSKDVSMGAKMINARSETLSEKPTFKTPYKKRRCLILADGFYEWRKEPDGGKTPMYIRLKGGKPFAFAGLWEVWHPGDDAIQSCTIITTSPNQMMATIHDRMPVILPPMAWEHWLEPDDQPASLLDPFLRPYPASEMEAYPVSKFVNSPANDNASCIQPA